MSNPIFKDWTTASPEMPPESPQIDSEDVPAVEPTRLQVRAVKPCASLSELRRKVHPLAAQAAAWMARGDAHRCIVLSYTEVLVINR